MHRVFVAILTCGLLPVLAAGQLPPGFELMDITNDNIRDRDPRMNDRGQIVFQAYMGPSVNDREIILYDNGEFIQLTDDNVPDGGPDINNDGVIVWLRPIGPDGPFGPTTEIMMYENGVVSRLTNDEFVDSHPRINGLGQVVWSRRVGEAPCGAGLYDVVFFDGQVVVQISNNALADAVGNFSAELNEHGDIVWTEYSNCSVPWTSRIMMYSEGEVTQLSPPGQIAPQVPVINKSRIVSWMAHDGVYLWDEGVVSQLTDWGAGPVVNNRGDIAISRWHDEFGAWQVWLYRQQEWYQLTNDASITNLPQQINRWGEVVMESGAGSLMWDVRLTQRVHGGGIEPGKPSPKQKLRTAGPPSPKSAEGSSEYP